MTAPFLAAFPPLAGFPSQANNDPDTFPPGSFFMSAIATALCGLALLPYAAFFGIAVFGRTLRRDCQPCETFFGRSPGGPRLPL
jgi:hypothetical protein